MSNDQREDLYNAGMLPNLSARAGGRIEPEHTCLPSRFAIGDIVTITAKIAGVNFSDGKVRYVLPLGEGIAIVDSCDVRAAPAAGKD